MLRIGKNRKKFIFQIFYLSILIILTFFALSLIFKGKQIEGKQNLEYCYKIENAIDYKVYMYENSFFDEKYLGMGKTYTSDLIEYIDINFKYNFSNAKKEDLEYTYDIAATIIGNYGTKKEDELWTKKYILKEEQTTQQKRDNSITLKENIKIKYEDYLNVVREFKKQLKLSIDAKLKITMTVTMKSSEIEDKQELNIYIPLTETTFKIDTEYNERVDDSRNGNTVLTENEGITNIVNGLTQKFGILLLIFNIVVFLITYKKVFEIKKKTYYEIELSKILKRYSEIIVEISNSIDINEETVISVRKIEDMIDIEEELRMPILYYEKRHKKEAWFIIKHGKDTYRYILKDKK